MWLHYCVYVHEITVCLHAQNFLDFGTHEITVCKLIQMAVCCSLYSS